MEEPPHIIVKTFEQLVMFPLDIGFLVSAGILLFHKEWLFGALLIFISFLIGCIAQAMPHHKRQTSAELRRGGLGVRYGKLGPEESFALAKSVLMTAFLVAMAAGATALHRGLRWYFVLISVACTWVLFPMLSILFCVGRSWLTEKSHTEPRNS